MAPRPWSDISESQRGTRMSGFKNFILRGNLIELAVANNVLPASPTNLIGLLRAVHYG